MVVRTFRKKPVVIEAVQFDGSEDSFGELSTFTDYTIKNPEGDKLVIPTLEGDHEVSKGDWVIKGVKGEFYPCKNDIFEMTYEEVEGDTNGS